MRRRPMDARDIDLGEARTLNPAAAPVDSYVRPAPVQGPNLDLVKALGGFSQELRGFADSQIALQEAQTKFGQKADEDEMQKAIGEYRKIADPAERRSFVNNHPLLAKKYKENALGALAGKDAAVEMDREYEQRKATTDPSEFNDQQVRAELYGKYMGLLPDNAAARSGFNATAGTLNQKNQDRADAERLKRDEGERDQGFMQTMRNSADEVNKAHEGKPPEERAGLVRKSIIEKMEILRTTKGLTRERAMGLMGSFLDQLAQEPGNDALVTSLLDGIDNKGATLRTLLGGKGERLEEAAKKATLADSEKKKAGGLADLYQRFSSGMDTPDDNAELERRLAEERETPQRAASLREASERAKAGRVEAQRRDFKDNAHNRFVEENIPALSSLAQNGQLYKVQGDEVLKSGDEEVRIKRDDLREAGLRAADKEIIARGTDNRKTAGQIWGERLRLYEKNGEDHPVAADLAKHVQRVGTGVTGDTVPQFMVDNWELVSAMRKDSPKMFDRLFKGDSRKFFDTLDIATEYARTPDGKIDFVRALREAQYVQQNGDKMPGIATKDMKTNVEAVVKRLAKDNPDAWLFSGSRAVDGNRGLTPEMQADVEARLTYFASRGAQGDTLAKRVAEGMRNDYALAGGRHVSIKDTGLAPKEAETVFKKMLGDYKAQNPNTKDEAVSIRREFDKWFVVDVAGMPLRGQPGFGISELQSVGKTMERKAVEVAGKGTFSGSDGYEYREHPRRKGKWERRKQGEWLFRTSPSAPPPEAPDNSMLTQGGI